MLINVSQPVKLVPGIDSPNLQAFKTRRYSGIFKLRGAPAVQPVSQLLLTVPAPAPRGRDSSGYPFQRCVRNASASLVLQDDGIAALGSLEQR